MEEETKLEMRVDGEASLPTLVYLPGLHGDWTLLTAFREMAKEKFRLVQFIYPRTLRWGLEDYAYAVGEALRREGITEGWVLAESFSSQVAWTWLKLAQEKGTAFRFDGIILAGGFVRYPMRFNLGAARALFAITPWWLWKVFFWVYLRYSVFRHRNAAGMGDSVHEFIDRRTPLDAAAMRARLQLIAESDPREVAKEAQCPIYMLAGVIDPVVPPAPVVRWLKRYCASFKGYKMVWPADHTVLATEPAKALAQIEEWVCGVSKEVVKEKESPRVGRGRSG